MRIGFDFDNTIVDYAPHFFKIANDLDIKIHNNAKNSIKYYYEEKLADPNSWKRIQYKVYCELIEFIKPSKSFISLTNWLVKNNHDFFIISHKTPKIKFDNNTKNLISPARQWIHNNIPFFNKSRIFFKASEISKINKIKSLRLDFFVDDLISIFNSNEFPTQTKKILFKNTISNHKNIYNAENWNEVKKIIIDKKE